MDSTANEIEKLLRIAEDTLCEYAESAERLDAKRELLRQLRALARDVHRNETPREVPSVSYSRPKYVPKWLKKSERDCGDVKSTTGGSGNRDINRDTRHNTNHNPHDIHNANKVIPKGERDTNRATSDTFRATEWITNRDSAEDTSNTPTKSNSSSPMSLTDKQQRDKQLLKRLTGTQKPKLNVELAAGWTRPAGLKSGVKLAPQARVAQVMSPAEKPEPVVPVKKEVRVRQTRVRGAR